MFAGPARVTHSKTASLLVLLLLYKQIYEARSTRTRCIAETPAGGDRHRGKAPHAADTFERAARAQAGPAADGGHRPGDPGRHQHRSRQGKRRGYEPDRFRAQAPGHTALAAGIDGGDAG